MQKVKLEKQIALDILDGDEEKGKVVFNQIVDRRRWTVIHRVIFLVGFQLLEGRYQVGATENQDEGPWEHQDNPEFTVVEAYDKTVTDYRPID